MRTARLMRETIQFPVLVCLVWFVGGFATPTGALAQSDAGLMGMDREAADAGESCRQDMIETLRVLKPEVGVESLREEAKTVCAEAGNVDVSTESIVDELSEIASDAADPDGENEVLWQLLSTLLYLALIVIPGGIVVWQMKRWSDTAEDWRDPAFEVDVSIDELRDDPELVDEIRGKVQFVGLQRLPSSSGGRYGGASMQVRYAAFLVDANGETHDVVKSSDWAAVEADAEWLADELDVRLEDATYGV